MNKFPSAPSGKSYSSRHPAPTVPTFEPNNCEGADALPVRKKWPVSQLFTVGMILILLMMSFIQIYQYKQLGEALEQNAYTLSVSINLMEDNLLLKHGFFPKDIGFDDLRSAWISTPCYETAITYHDALQNALEYLDKCLEPINNYNPIPV